MSESALAQASTTGHVELREMGLQGMVTLRGDLTSHGMGRAVHEVTGQAIPAQGGIHGDLGAGVAWMSPDELMLFCPHDEAEALAARLAKALAGQHHLALNVSDARAVFGLKGDGVRGVMAKLSPMDWHRSGFGPGELRRTRLAQIPAAIWMPEEGAVNLICFRSVARYAFDLLSNAADPSGPLPPI